MPKIHAAAIRIVYDEDADVLYVTFEDSPGSCSYVENDLGDILRIDKQSDRVIGCTIPFFSSRQTDQGVIEVPQVASIPLNEKVWEAYREAGTLRRS